MCLLYKLSIRAVVHGVINVIQEVESSDVSVLYGATADGTGALAGVLLAETSVCIVERSDIGSDSQRSINLRVLALQLRLVEVVDVGHVCAVSRWYQKQISSSYH